MQSPLIGLHIYRRQSMALISKNFIVCVFVLPEENGRFKEFSESDLLVLSNWQNDSKFRVKVSK